MKNHKGGLHLFAHHLKVLKILLDVQKIYKHKFYVKYLVYLTIHRVIESTKVTCVVCKINTKLRPLVDSSTILCTEWNTHKTFYILKILMLIRLSQLAHDTVVVGNLKTYKWINFLQLFCTFVFTSFFFTFFCSFEWWSEYIVV